MKELLFLISIITFTHFVLGQDIDSSRDTCISYVPNTLTPDCDFYPCDVLTVALSCPYTKFNIKIFNRWGEVIFESDDEKHTWDCTFKGTYVTDGTYTWKLKVDFESGQQIDESGHVNVLR